MKSETFEQIWGWLVKFHGKTPTDAFRETFHTAFESEHDDVFCKAAMLHDQKQSPGLFPTVEKFRGYVTEAREKAWESKKQAEPRRPLSNYRPAGDFRNVERGRRWMAGIIAVSEGRIKAEQLIETMGRGSGEEG